VDLAGEIHVGVKASLAPEQSDVLESLDRLPDTEFAHLGGEAYHKLMLRRPLAPLLEWLRSTPFRS
jgi:hypothetical protein